MAKKKKVDWEPGTYYGSNKYNEAAGLYSGESRKASWVDDEGNKRSWKEGPFRNRAVETWNGTKRIYKKGKEEGYDGDLWNLKKKKEYGVGFTEEVDGITHNVSKTITTTNKKDGTVDVKKRYEDKEQRKMMRKVDRNKRRGKTE